jgi:hypothetical protein
MEDAEKMAATRVRVGEQNEDRITGNWVYAEFVHLTARPENGIPDPHLHTHCYVFNVTWDGVEKRFKAAQLGDVVEAAPDFQSICAMRVSENLRKLGLEIVPTKEAFEIAGISRKLIKKFSQRTETIEAKARKLGITDPVEKAKLGALTRENKNPDLTIPELGLHWWPRLDPEEKAALEGLKTLLQRSLVVELSQQIKVEAVTALQAGRSSEALGTQQTVGAAVRRQSMNQKTRPGPTAQEEVKVTEHDRRAVALAMEHLFERESVVTEIKLRGEAIRSWCIGRASLGGIDKVVAEAPLLRREWNGKPCVTTAEVLAEERRCIDACISGKGRFEAMNPDWRIRDPKLNEGQRGAVTHVLDSRDFVTGISGKAGTGKTTLLHEAKKGIEASGNKLLVLAPTAEAARDVLRKQGRDEILHHKH